MADHAILSPSSAERWLNCTPSARLEQEFPESTNDAADEGTLAHSLGELLIKNALGRIPKKVFNDLLREIMKNKHYNASMLDHCQDYADFVIEQFTAAKVHTEDAILYLEKQLDLSDYVPEGFGTGDAGIIADQWLTVIDLKYGKGVPVTAVNNKQMRLYSLGALKDYDDVYDIKMIRMIIFQPRLDSVTTDEISVKALRKWAKDELIPLAELAFEGSGEFVPGNHCGFCKAKAKCKAFATYNLELAKYDFSNPGLMSPKEIADVLERSKLFSNWISAVVEHALSEAVQHGKAWPGYKLVYGRSNRKYSDENKVVETLKEAGFGEDEIFDESLKGITALENIMGKKKFSALLGDLIIKPPGKPTLAPLNDKRPAYNSADAARLDFAEPI